MQAGPAAARADEVAEAAIPEAPNAYSGLISNRGPPVALPGESQQVLSPANAETPSVFLSLSPVNGECEGRPINQPLLMQVGRVLTCVRNNCWRLVSGNGWIDGWMD
jgi:hypothetical protein